MEYTLEDHRPVMLGNCRGENVLQRYGQVLAQRSFQSGQAGERVSFVSVKATDEQLWPALAAELAGCAPPQDVSIDNDIVVTVQRAVAVVDGPAVGDDSVWFTTTTQIENSVTGASEPMSYPTVLVRTGDHVFEVSGPLGADQATVEGYARAALEP